jgi:outer membrane protein assembly factor BamB
VNTQNGKERWKFRTDKPVVATPVVFRNMVYVGSTDENFYALDAETGRERWKFKAGGSITSAACLSKDAILFGSMDKTLYAIPLVG